MLCRMPTRACTTQRLSLSLSLNLWGYLNLAVAGTTAPADLHNVKWRNRREAWRRIVVPLKPRSEVERNAFHTAVNAPPKFRSLALVINDLDDWEKVVEEFELCDGVMTDNDRRTVLRKKLPSTVHSSLIFSLRKCKSQEAMKTEIDA